GAVGALVDAAVQVAAGVQAAPELEGGAGMRGLSGADEAVVADIELAPEIGKRRSNSRHMRKRSKAALGGDALDVDAVLVGAGYEEGVAAVQAVVARDGVGGDGGVSVADMRNVIGVVDRGGEIDRVGHGWGTPRRIGIGPALHDRSDAIE